MDALDVKGLWAKAKGGNRNAWHVLFQSHYQANIATAKRITRNLEDAEDAVQDSWLEAWERRALIVDLGGYIRRAIASHAIDIVRSREARRIAFSYPFQGEDEPIELPAKRPTVEPESMARAWIEANPRFAERMNAWVTAHGDRLLAPRDREIAARLWCERPTQSRQEVADRLGMTLQEVEAAVKRICRKRDQTGKPVST